MALTNDQRDVKAQCQIVWYPWITETLAPAVQPDYSLLSDSYAFDLSAHLIQNCTFSKNRGSPAGHFSFKLDNSRDWKSIIRPGQWLNIFMTNDGDLKFPTTSPNGEGFNGLPVATKDSINKAKLRGVCYVERVSVSTMALDNGALDVIYEVSGRDYGVIYEETSIWYNYFQFEQLQVTGLSDKVQFSNARTIKDLLNTTHDLFYAPGKIIKGKTDASEFFGEVGVQWLLPRKMLSNLDIPLIPEDQNSFYGNIANLQNFSKTVSTIAITDPLSYINGNSWEKLKEFSVKELHELFVELDDAGNMNIIFRPIPWAIDSSGYEDLASNLDDNLFYLNLADSAGVNISASDVISASIGEENHNRYNHFMVTSTSSMGVPFAAISTLKGQKSETGREFPYIQKPSIRRHGFRPMHVDVDSLGQFTGGTLDVDYPILLQVNELIYDYWNNAIFFESGTFSLVGRNDVRVGKTLNCALDIPYNADKIFYIEEYVDEFNIDEERNTSWVQTISVSRGIERSSLAELSGFSRKQNKFTNTADYVGDKG